MNWCPNCGRQVWRILRIGAFCAMCGALLVHGGEHPSEEFNPLKLQGGRVTATVTSTSIATTTASSTFLSGKPPGGGSS
jgi:hypothetical protein